MEQPSIEDIGAEIGSKIIQNTSFLLLSPKLEFILDFTPLFKSTEPKPGHALPWEVYMSQGRLLSK